MMLPEELASLLNVDTCDVLVADLDGLIRWVIPDDAERPRGVIAVIARYPFSSGVSLAGVFRSLAFRRQQEDYPSHSAGTFGAIAGADSLSRRGRHCPCSSGGSRRGILLCRDRLAAVSKWLWAALRPPARQTHWNSLPGHRCQRLPRSSGTCRCDSSSVDSELGALVNQSLATGLSLHGIRRLPTSTMATSARVYRSPDVLSSADSPSLDVPSWLVAVSRCDCRVEEASSEGA